MFFFADAEGLQLSWDAGRSAYFANAPTSFQSSKCRENHDPERPQRISLNCERADRSHPPGDDDFREGACGHTSRQQKLRLGAFSGFPEGDAPKERSTPVRTPKRGLWHSKGNPNDEDELPINDVSHPPDNVEYDVSPHRSIFLLASPSFGASRDVS